jgi:molybdopterin-guanine dinucleotide biosynthesis protein
MSIIVVGGHSRSVGKTSVVAGLISALPERPWTAIKITQFGHGICANHGGECGCSSGVLHEFAIDEEHDRDGDSDTSRFLKAGAQRVLWVRTRQGFLALAMPDLRAELARATDVIIESNSVMQYLRPDLYLVVLDPSTSDFKPTAKHYLDLASAVILHDSDSSPAWQNVSLKPVAERPLFRIHPPNYVTPEIVDFVRTQLPTTAHSVS